MFVAKSLYFFILTYANIENGSARMCSHAQVKVTLENSGKLALEVVYEGDSLCDTSFSCADNYWIETRFRLLAIVCFKNILYFENKNYFLILHWSYPLRQVISETLSNFSLFLFSFNC